MSKLAKPAPRRPHPAGCKEIHDLPSTPEMPGGTGLDLFRHAPESLTEEVIEVPTDTIGREGSEVMQVDVSLTVGRAG